MEKTRNILFWLGQKEEREILNDELKHVEISLKCVEEMKNAVECFVKGKIEEKNTHIANVKNFEHLGDDIRKKITLELSKGLLFPPDREDLLILNEGLNDIADGAKGIARLLEFFEEKITEDMGNSLLSFSIITLKAGEKLKDAIDSLIKNDIQKLLEDCANIETLEEEGDDRRRELIRELIKENLSAPKAILLYEIIDTMENLTDSIKKAGDLVRILGIKSK
ncbi:MAG: TIGR00153 family protein [Candidatus Omnitrophica bacterium]|nr:TIGR00153 family protein [Candidatus Omnitrophota bacterium]MCM8808097.1 TIGR00153 family protein [Candidatus Omnitrophota bacterium]